MATGWSGPARRVSMSILIAALMVIIAAATGCVPDDNDDVQCTPEDATSTLEGIYELEEYTHNAIGCEEAGPPAAEQTEYSHFFVRMHLTCFGDAQLETVLCEDLETCRRGAAGTYTREPLLVFDGSDATGWSSSPTDLRHIGDGTGCEGTVETASLTGEGGVRVRISWERRTLTNVPYDDMYEERYCDFEAASAQAADKPCEQLTVVSGVYVSKIGPL